MAKLTAPEPKHPKPKSFAPPSTRKVMEGGYGTVKSSRPKESAIIKKSRAQLIQRLGILPRKSK